MAKKKIDYSAWSKDELVKELTRIKDTTYGLVWHKDIPQEKLDILINPDARTPEETFSNEVSGKPFPVLNEDISKAIIIDDKKPVNVLIEGDNYHSLAVLNFTHQEAVDLIYIDPPYNTGNNDFTYNDNLVDREDPFRHSKWLSFMDKRLRLSKNLLCSSGIIFISIDDNEYAPLKMLCDEIFGEANFIASFIWESKLTGGHDSKHVNTVHEYVLCYVKDSTNLDVIGKRQSNTEYPQYDDVRQQSYKWDSLWTVSHGYTRNCDYPIASPTGKDIYPWMCHKDGTKVKGIARWFWSKETYQDKKSELQVKEDKAGQWKVYKKVYGGSDIPFKSILDKSIVGGTSHGKEALEKIFEKVNVFSNPKSVTLVKELIKMCPSKNATILDFMAGSGTTGQAVMELNKEDNGERKFILCTNNENDICTKVCYPRIKKITTGYTNSKGVISEGLNHNLRYFKAYDFVESEPTDKNKRKLVKKSTEMLSIKEGVYDLVIETEEFKILKNAQNKYLGIIFYEEAIEAYKEELKDINHKVMTYVFSLGDDPHKVEFDDVADKVILQPIPDVILRVYQEIFK